MEDTSADVASRATQVGSVVRGPWRAPYNRRGVVATLEDQHCTILWERHDKNGWFWRQVSSLSGAASSKREGEEDEEAQVPVGDVQTLHSFEELRDAPKSSEETSRQRRTDCKSCGDTLLVKAKDPLAACAWYEEALRDEDEIPKVGSTVVLCRNGGHLILADVDCVEGGSRDKTSLDVTFLGANKEPVEESVGLSEIWLRVWEDKDARTPQDSSVSLLQIRILLNLARCIIQLSEISATNFLSNAADDDNSFGGIMAVPEYRTAAIVACSLALTCIEHWSRGHDDEKKLGTSTDLEIKARLLRAGVYRHLVSKHKHAISDIRHVLQLRPNHKEATRLLQQCEASKKQQHRVNRKLARDVSTWVHEATTAPTHEENQEQALLKDKESQGKSSIVDKGKNPGARDSEIRSNVATASAGAVGTSALFWGVTVIAMIVGAFFLVRGDWNTEAF